MKLNKIIAPTREGSFIIIQPWSSAYGDIVIGDLVIKGTEHTSKEMEKGRRAVLQFCRSARESGRSDDLAAGSCRIYYNCELCNSDQNVIHGMCEQCRLEIAKSGH